MKIIGNSYRASIATMIVVCGIAVAAFAAMAGTAAAASFSDRFPETGAFNDMAIEYTVSGFTVGQPQDRDDFVESRYASGKITSRTITITGTVYGDDDGIPPDDSSTWEYKCLFVGQPPSYYEMLMSGNVPPYDNNGGFQLYGDTNYPTKTIHRTGLKTASEDFEWTLDVPTDYPYMLIYITVGIHPSSADDGGILIGYMLENPYYIGDSSGSPTSSSDYDDPSSSSSSSSSSTGGGPCCCCGAVIFPLLALGTVYTYNRKKQ